MTQVLQQSGIRTIERSRPTALQTRPLSRVAPTLAGEGQVWSDGALTLDGRSYVVGRRHGIGDSRVMLAFDVSSLLGRSISSATLRLPVIAPDAGVFDCVEVVLDHVEGQGLLRTSDYNAKTLSAAMTPLRTADELVVNVTDCVWADLAASRTVSTFRLRLDVQTLDVSRWSIGIGASGHEDPKLRPALLIC